jgi:hypothetical protein
MDMTYREARLYLGAAVIFLGSLLGGALAYGQAQVQLHGAAGLLLLIPALAAVVIMSIARTVAVRSSPRLGHLPLVFAWGLAAARLMWGFALPTALRRLRRGR